MNTNPDLTSIDSLAPSMSLMMVADKLTELLHPPSATGNKLPRLTLEALHHFHKGPAFATESQTPVRIVMGKMVQLAFEVSASIVHLYPP